MFCWFFRLMISHAADGDSRLSETTEKHIRHCASCREFYEICLSLGEGLAREAAISNEEVSERLSAHILKGMSRRRIGTYTIGLRMRPMVAAACVALIVLMGVLFLAVRRDGQDTGQPGQVEPVAALRALVGENFPAVWPGLIEEPLAGELNNLADDTESALRFLVACVAVDITDTEMNQRIE
ncbi:hypothetical protein ES703_68497 [subsurface metagenome]